MNNIVRKSLLFHGRVQGVGFRYTAQQLAREHGLTGWARNNADGTVSVEVQGSVMGIKRMMDALMRDGYIKITKMDAADLPVAEGEKKFSISYSNGW